MNCCRLGLLAWPLTLLPASAYRVPPRGGRRKVKLIRVVSRPRADHVSSYCEATDHGPSELDGGRNPSNLLTVNTNQRQTFMIISCFNAQSLSKSKNNWHWTFCNGRTIRCSVHYGNLAQLSGTWRHFSCTPLWGFESVTNETVLSSWNKIMSLKTCILDPIPTSLLFECSNEIVPLLTAIVNQSLSTGIFPSCMKAAMVKPLSKKTSLEPDVL